MGSSFEMCINILKDATMIENIRINTKLLTSLSEVILLPATEIIAVSDIPNTTYYNLMNNPSSITVQQLLGLANGLHIPVRRFFCTGHTDIIGRREDYLADPYLPCSYDSEALKRIVSLRRTATWRRAADAVGMTPLRLRDSLLAVRRLPVDRFLAVCGVFDEDPFSILLDPNPEPEKGRKPSRRGDVELRRQMADLGQRVNHLVVSVDNLAEKYKALLEDQQRLLQRINVHIENFNDSNLNTAEAPADLKKK